MQDKSSGKQCGLPVPSWLLIPPALPVVFPESFRTTTCTLKTRGPTRQFTFSQAHRDKLKTFQNGCDSFPGHPTPRVGSFFLIPWTWLSLFEKSWDQEMKAIFISVPRWTWFHGSWWFLLYLITQSLAKNLFHQMHVFLIYRLSNCILTVHCYWHPEHAFIQRFQRDRKFNVSWVFPNKTWRLR